MQESLAKRQRGRTQSMPSAQCRRDSPIDILAKHRLDLAAILCPLHDVERPALHLRMLPKRRAIYDRIDRLTAEAELQEIVGRHKRPAGVTQKHGGIKRAHACIAPLQLPLKKLH